MPVFVFAAKAPSAEAEEVYFRYYHMFEEGELELLCAQVDEVCVEKSYYDQGNWCVILRKLWTSSGGFDLDRHSKVAFFYK